ncbi:MAG: aldehyde dehydrogenase family protein [Thermoanaerobaculales bacterium]
MGTLTDQEIEAIAQRIATDLEGPAPAAAPGARGSSLGVFASVDEAVQAAREAQPIFVALPLTQRAAILAGIRRTMLDNAETLARSAHAETGLGRWEDKLVKNRLVTEKTAGLEELYPLSVTGDHGLTLTEPAPFGVIGAITPCTNPTSTIICNAIGMLAAGNTVVFNVHPLAKRCSIETIDLLNQAIVAAGGPPNVVTCLSDPTIETAQETMRHPGVRLLVVTGGGAVVKAAMASGKRAICAGPGNPPVVVDETADIGKAARDIVLGASTDNNIICTDEKEVICVASVADDLLKAIAKCDAVVLGPHQLPALEKLLFTGTQGPRKQAHINKDLIGKNAGFILGRLGMSVPDTVRLGVVEVDVDHPLLWTEQMMPILPMCRVRSADAAIDLAVQVEGGNRHTAVMHSKQLDNLSRMAKACDCSIFVKNGRSQAGLGLDGEGYCSFTIASPTGEGMTGPRSFSRWRRCVLVDHFRIT